MEQELDKSLSPLIGALVTQTLDTIETLLSKEKLNKKELQSLLDELKDIIEGDESILSPKIKGRLMEVTQYTLGIDKGYDLQEAPQDAQHFDDNATK